MDGVGGLKFLVVDDFPTMRRIVKAQLQEIGCAQVAEAADGAVALHLLRQTSFDVVISDIHMPVMNGFDLLHAMKADPALCGVPLLLMTAEVRPEDIALAAQSGAAGVIVKPLKRAVLEVEIHKLQEPVATTA